MRVIFDFDGNETREQMMEKVSAVLGFNNLPVYSGTGTDIVITNELLPAAPKSNVVPLTGIVKRQDDTRANIEGTTAGAPSVDSRGIPWDSRVHSSSKAINESDGQWKKMRGVDPKLLSKVEAELLVKANEAATVITNPATVFAENPAGPAMPPGPGAAISAGPAMPPKQPDNAPVSFVDLMKWIGKHSQTVNNPTGKLLPEMVTSICKHYEFGSIQDVAREPDFVPYIYQYLTQTIGEPYLPGHVELT